jgi:hypothetical protein
VGLEDLIWIGAASAAAAAGALAAFWTVRTKLYHSVPPNRALVLFGRGSTDPTLGSDRSLPNVSVRPPRILVGGGAYVAPGSKGVGQLSLDPISVDVLVRSVHSLDGARASGWEVQLQVQAKVPAEPRFLALAAENLLGKADEEVRAIIRRTVEGAVPAVLARIPPSSVEPDWEHLAAEIQASVAPDLVPWGLAVRTLSLVELRRILPNEPTGPLSRPSPSTELSESRGHLLTLLEQLDERLAGTERTLGVMGAELLRMSQESVRASEDRSPASVLDLPLGWESSSSADRPVIPEWLSHDSMGGERSPKPRPTPIGAGAGANGSDPRLPVE